MKTTDFPSKVAYKFPVIATHCVWRCSAPRRVEGKTVNVWTGTHSHFLMNPFEVLPLRQKLRGGTGSSQDIELKVNSRSEW